LGKSRAENQFEGSHHVKPTRRTETGNFYKKKPDGFSHETGN